MNRYNWILILIMITGCQVVVDFDIPLEKQKLVVNALINPDSTWRVSVSKSWHILDEGYQAFVPAAVITITDQHDNLISILSQERIDEYRSDSKPLPGATYKLKAEVPGYETVFAQTNIPHPVPIMDVTVDTIMKDYGYAEVVANIKFNDPPEKNYYQVYASVKMIVQLWDPNGMKTDTVTYLYPLYLSQSELEESAAVFNDLKFNGTTAKVSVRLNYWPHGTMLEQHIILLHLNEAYYNYEVTRRLQEQTQGDPFFAQPVQVFSNITNGMGIFAGCAGYSYELQ
ncbi:MAG: DUF4249 domain-containing protein [Cyclobacteriaceae bacterium]|nr:DUF4249 domain-containing protein [Cyclobacteriaceae bacterium]